MTFLCRVRRRTFNQCYYVDCHQLLYIVHQKFIVANVVLIVHCSAMVSAFEKAKKKYVVKVKKMETQMQLMTERHESQVNFITVMYYFISSSMPLRI